MGERVTRRDFLSGMQLAVGGAMLTPWEQLGLTGDPAEYYPPALTGLRGTHDGAWETMHARVSGQTWPVGKPEEQYDLIVVGGGISGLSAAHLYRQHRPRAQVLVLDNHDDFGGHAKRNEFRINGLAKSIVFDQETFGQQKLVTGCWQKPWEEFARESPLNERAKRDLIRIMTEKVDYLSRPISSSTPRTSSSRLSSTTRCRSASTSGPRPRTSRWCFTCATSTTARATRVRSNGGRAGAG